MQINKKWLQTSVDDLNCVRQQRKISLRYMATKNIVIIIKKYLHDYINSHIFVSKDCFVSASWRILAMTVQVSKY